MDARRRTTWSWPMDWLMVGRWLSFDGKWPGAAAATSGLSPFEGDSDRSDRPSPSIKPFGPIRLFCASGELGALPTDWRLKAFNWAGRDIFFSLGDIKVVYEIIRY